MCATIGKLDTELTTHRAPPQKTQFPLLIGKKVWNWYCYPLNTKIVLMASKGKRNVMMPEINRYQVSTIMNYVLKNFSYRVAYLSKSANLSVLVNHITNCRLARSFGKPSNLLSRSLFFRVWVITKDNRHTKKHYSKCILRGPFVSVNSLLLPPDKVDFNCQ